MNKVVTSREAIVTVCRRMAEGQGLQALNMRSVAEECKVSVGSVYNYFPSKADLIAATVQAVWQNIFHPSRACGVGSSFVECVEWLFSTVRQGAAEYPNFFTAHSMSFASGGKDTGRRVMDRYFGHMKQGLMGALANDPAVRADAFDDSFTQAALVDFVFSSLLSLLLKGESSCWVLCEIVRRTIY